MIAGILIPRIARSARCSWFCFQFPGVYALFKVRFWGFILNSNPILTLTLTLNLILTLTLTLNPILTEILKFHWKKNLACACALGVRILANVILLSNSYNSYLQVRMFSSISQIFQLATKETVHDFKAFTLVLFCQSISYQTSF